MYMKKSVYLNGQVATHFWVEGMQFESPKYKLFYYKGTKLHFSVLYGSLTGS